MYIMSHGDKRYRNEALKGDKEMREGKSFKLRWPGKDSPEKVTFEQKT